MILITMPISPNFYKKIMLKISYILIISFTLLGCSKPEVKKETNLPYIQSAEIVKISPESSFTLLREYIGKVSAKQQTNLSFEYSGRVIETLVDSGEHVVKGQALAIQDSELLLIKVAEIEAKVKQVNAQIVLNKANQKRINALIDDGYTSEQSVDELAAQDIVLEANLDGLKASKASLNYQIKKSKLTAPYDGVVSERLLSVGDNVPAGQPVFKLHKQTQQEISLGIPYSVADSLQLNDIVEVQIANHRTTAKVIAKGQNISTTNRTVQLRLMLNESQKNANGQIARVYIKQIIEREGFWVPLSAITDGIRGQWNIYLANTKDSNSFQISAATINVEFANESHAFISGLSNNEYKIVAAGLHRYVPGQLIKPVENKPTTAKQGSPSL